MPDTFENFTVGLNSPTCAHAEAVDISASDHTCTNTTRFLYVGGTGDVIATIDGTDITFAAVPAGERLPIRATVIKQTGTTATDMVAMW